MDYASREFMMSFRRLLAAMLCLSLLVAFWADRPVAAASYPGARTGTATNPVMPSEPFPAAAPTQPAPTSLISWVRRPWLGVYTILGAPNLTGYELSQAEQDQFRFAVGRLAAFFFALAGGLWWRGQRLIREARRP